MPSFAEMLLMASMFFAIVMIVKKVFSSSDDEEDYVSPQNASGVQSPIPSPVSSDNSQQKADESTLSKTESGKDGCAEAEGSNARIDTIELCYGILRNLNCEVEFLDGSDDNKTVMTFRYQNEYFRLEASNTSYMVSLYDIGWWSVDLNDIDEVSRVRKVINDVNYVQTVKLIYYIDKEHNTMEVFSVHKFLVFKEIPCLDDMMTSSFTEFFRAQQIFHSYLLEERKNDTSKSAE